MGNETKLSVFGEQFVLPDKNEPTARSPLSPYNGRGDPRP